MSYTDLNKEKLMRAISFAEKLAEPMIQENESFFKRRQEYQKLREKIQKYKNDKTPYLVTRRQIDLLMQMFEYGGEAVEKKDPTEAKLRELDQNIAVCEKRREELSQIGLPTEQQNQFRNTYQTLIDQKKEFMKSQPPQKFEIQLKEKESTYFERGDALEVIYLLLYIGTFCEYARGEYLLQRLKICTEQVDFEKYEKSREKECFLSCFAVLTGWKVVDTFRQMQMVPLHKLVVDNYGNFLALLNSGFEKTNYAGEGMQEIFSLEKKASADEFLLLKKGKGIYFNDTVNIELWLMCYKKAMKDKAYNEIMQKSLIEQMPILQKSDIWKFQNKEFFAPYEEAFKAKFREKVSEDEKKQIAFIEQKAGGSFLTRVEMHDIIVGYREYLVDHLDLIDMSEPIPEAGYFREKIIEKVLQEVPKLADPPKNYPVRDWFDDRSRIILDSYFAWVMDGTIDDGNMRESVFRIIEKAVELLFGRDMSGERIIYVLAKYHNQKKFIPYKRAFMAIIHRKECQEKNRERAIELFAKATKGKKETLKKKDRKYTEYIALVPLILGIISGLTWELFYTCGTLLFFVWVIQQRDVRKEAWFTTLMIFVSAGINYLFGGYSIINICLECYGRAGDCTQFQAVMVTVIFSGFVFGLPWGINMLSVYLKAKKLRGDK